MNTDEKHGVSEVGSTYTASDLASDSSRKAIGARLFVVRGGDTQEGMATRMGVYKNTYSRWERGEREPSATDLVHLAKEGWNINWLLTGAGSKQTEPLQEAALDVQPVMMQKAVESAIGVFKRFNKTPTASQLARASVLLYLMFTDSEPDPTQPVDQLLARIMSEPNDTDPLANFPKPPHGFVGF